MKDGERLVRWLTFRDVDRPPFYQIFEGWDETMTQWKHTLGLRELDLSVYFNMDHGFVCVPVALGLFPPFETRVIEDSEHYRIWQDERGITKRERRDHESMPEFLEYPVKNWDDWQELKRARLDPDHPGRYPASWEAFNGYLQKTGSVAQLGRYPYGLFGTARDLMGAEGLLLACYDQPDLVWDILETLTDVWLRIYQHVVRHTAVACIHMWEDMCYRQGPLISPAMIEDLMLPNYGKISAFANDYAIPLFSVDSDGDVARLVPLMLRAGVNVFFPFEVQAGCNIEAYRPAYPQLGIMGGLDKRALARGQQAIDAEIARAERMLQSGGYVASLDHSVPPDVPWQNYRYYIEQLHRIIFARQRSA